MAKTITKLSAVLANKCPRCHEGDIYIQKGIFPLNKMLKMHERCEVCGQKTELEVGFYYGTGYVSYGLSLAIAIVVFVLYVLIFGFSWVDNSIWYYMGITTILLILVQPYMMRLSRSIYLSMFVKYDPNAKENVIPTPTEEQKQKLQSS